MPLLPDLVALVGLQAVYGVAVFGGTDRDTSGMAISPRLATKTFENIGPTYRPGKLTWRGYRGVKLLTLGPLSQ
jgi:hypothetical protein